MRYDPGDDRIDDERGAMDEAQVAVRRHQWMSLKFTPVEPLGLDAEGEPAILHVGDMEERVACTVCLLGLRADNMDTECPGEEQHAGEG
jgi:hypothetical protein